MEYAIDCTWSTYLLYLNTIHNSDLRLFRVECPKKIHFDFMTRSMVNKLFIEYDTSISVADRMLRNRFTCIFMYIFLQEHKKNWHFIPRKKIHWSGGEIRSWITFRLSSITFMREIRFHVKRSHEVSIPIDMESNEVTTFSVS